MKLYSESPAGRLVFITDVPGHDAASAAFHAAAAAGAWPGGAPLLVSGDGSERWRRSERPVWEKVGPARGELLDRQLASMEGFMSGWEVMTVAELAEDGFAIGLAFGGGSLCGTTGGGMGPAPWIRARSMVRHRTGLLAGRAIPVPAPVARQPLCEARGLLVYQTSVLEAAINPLQSGAGWRIEDAWAYCGRAERLALLREVLHGGRAEGMRIDR